MNNTIIQIVYYTSAILFIIGLKRMSSPKTARTGIQLAGIGMLLTIIVTIFFPGMHNFPLMTLAIIIGATIAWISAKKVAMTEMPEMIALYNGMGGGAAAAIAGIELLKLTGTNPEPISISTFTLAIVGGLIGSVSFSGSILAFFKLRNWLKNIYFPMQQFINIAVLITAISLGIFLNFSYSSTVLVAFFASSLLYGVLMTMSIGGADMPVVIALYNAFTGLAVACEGFVMNNIAMIIAGTIVGSAGTLLTLLMAKAMNRPLSNVIFTRFGGSTGTAVEGTTKSLELKWTPLSRPLINKISE